MKSLFRLTDIRGALVTMPHKVTRVSLLGEVTSTLKIAGACNAILRRPDGSLLGDQFDGTGFVHGVERKVRSLAGASALVVGSGGLCSAVVAPLAATGVVRMGVSDANDSAELAPQSRSCPIEG